VQRKVANIKIRTIKFGSYHKYVQSFSQKNTETLDMCALNDVYCIVPGASG